MYLFNTQMGMVEDISFFYPDNSDTYDEHLNGTQFLRLKFGIAPLRSSVIVKLVTHNRIFCTKTRFQKK